MEISTKKQAILILSDKSSEWIIQNYNKIKGSVSEDYDVFFLYHQRNNYSPDEVKNINHFVFTDEILSELKYKPLTNSLIPGSNHFPLLKFYLQNPHYDYYWNIEDDVCFQGNWSNLFDAFVDYEADFISSQIASFDELPNWYWWFSLNSNGQDIPMKNKVRSFNPIYRLSNRALALLDHSLQNGWSGHHEVVIPTLLFHNNLKISDFGGVGSFVPKGNENKFYNDESMSYLPIEMGVVENQLYHPIKEKKQININTLKKYCIISAVGQQSLHRGWINEFSDFDLHLIIYDNSYNRFYNDTNFITYQKGYKLRLVYDYILKNPVYLEKYEYFFFPDDNISMDSENISALFEYMEAFNLQIAQPALSDSYYTYKHTLKNKFCQLRFTNFVEMMAPCFSRNALRKVLHSFNENSRGWGIEYHWAQLIDYKGDEMAIIDDLHAVQTRPPNQLFNQQNATELNDYIQKYNLNLEIKDYSFIPIKAKQETNWKQIINDQETYTVLEYRLEQIANILIESIYSQAKNDGTGVLEGILDISLFFLNYYQLSGKKKYKDYALSVVDWASERIGLLKDDFSFSTGMPRFSWHIEYLAQHGFVDCDTNVVLEDICEHLNNTDFINKADLNFPYGVIGYGQHYLSRMNNANFTIEKELGRKEAEILELIIARIEQYYAKSFELKINGVIDYKVVSDCILFLCKTNALLPDSDTIKALIEKLVHEIEKGRPSKKFSALQKAYTLFLASEVLADNSLRLQSLDLAQNSARNSQITNRQTLFDIHLLNRFYQETDNDIFRDQVFSSLKSSFISGKENILELIRNKDDKTNSIVTNDLCELGLIIISAMTDYKTDWDYCMLL
jgi:hypothetical protein